jgi:hypothetical protein
VNLQENQAFLLVWRAELPCDSRTSSPSPAPTVSAAMKGSPMSSLDGDVFWTMSSFRPGQFAFFYGRYCGSNHARDNHKNILTCRNHDRKLQTGLLSEISPEDYVYYCSININGVNKNRMVKYGIFAPKV